MNRGSWAAVVAYLLWGVFPIYWKLVKLPPFELLAHRMSWSFVFMMIVLLWRQDWAWLKKTAKQPKILRAFLLSATLVSCNWFIYIWAVNSGYIVDASLGYFINPLVNVLFGRLILGEQLRRWQLAAVLLATSGVVYLALSLGVVLWIALSLAITFALYGLLRKTAALGAIEGLSLETSFMFIPALCYLLYLEYQGAGAFGHTTVSTLFLLSTGFVTAVPLLLFAYGARQISFTTLGLLQYLAPTLQFLIGVFVYGEDFGIARQIGFALIWIALFLYSLEGWTYRRQLLKKLQRS